MLPVYLRERLYLPSDHIKVSQLEREFTQTIYTDRGKCRECEYVMDSPCDMCEQCDNFGGTFKLYKHVLIDGDDYVGVPVGSRQKVIRLWPQLRKCERVDERPAPRLKWIRDWEFLWDLYDYQGPAIDAMVAKGYGVLHSPPRSGKTPMAVAMMLRLGLRVLILASQRDWLEQFMETFHTATNIRDIEQARGTRLCGIADKDQDFQTLDICLATYQSFISDGNGKKRFDWVRERFGVLIVDEVHQVGATEFSKIVNGLNCRHKFGLTGTPARKDGRWVLPEHIIGPVTHEVEIQSMVPLVRFTETEFDRTYKTWTPYIRALSKDDARNQLIVDIAMWYLEQGHSIVIPVYHVDHVDVLVHLINEEAGKVMAKGFTGRISKADRRQLILDARSGVVRVVVGIRKITQTGLNIPKLSCLLEVAPISNTPQHTQEVSRVLTPLPDKPPPVIHYLVDHTGIGIGCLKNCVINTHKAQGHKISSKSWEKLSKWFNKRGGRNVDPDDAPPVKSAHGSRPDREARKPDPKQGLFKKARSRL